VQSWTRRKNRATGEIYSFLLWFSPYEPFSLFTFRGFKALKQSTKLLYLTLRRPNDALKTYTQLLTYTKSAVTRNYSEKSINGILDYVGGGKGGPVEVDILEKFYQATKNALEDAKNEVWQILHCECQVADRLHSDCQSKRT
jgi:hypothetical protein